MGVGRVVRQAVMMRAQQRAVLQIRLPSGSPGFEVVSVAPFRWHVAAFGLAALLLEPHRFALDGLEEPA
ncbi:MAG TPA: hypothetical protein VIP06_06370, partial [Nocardioides sp.]